MRISGMVIGIIGFGLLIMFTGICSLVTFGLSEQYTVDLWDNGQSVGSLFDVVQGLVDDDPFDTNVQTVAEQPTITPFIDVEISTIAPNPTAVPTQDVGYRRYDRNATCQFWHANPTSTRTTF